MSTSPGPTPLRARLRAVEPVVVRGRRGSTAIDTFDGRARNGINAAYLLDGDEPALVETGPAASFEPVVLAAFERLGHRTRRSRAHRRHPRPSRSRRAARAGSPAGSRTRPSGCTNAARAHLADPRGWSRARRASTGRRRMATFFGPVEPVAARTDPRARRRRPYRPRRAAPRGRSHTPGSRHASRGARRLARPAPSSRATRSGLHPPGVARPPPGAAATRVRRRARARQRSRGSPRAARDPLAVLALRSGRTTSDADLRPRGRAYPGVDGGGRRRAHAVQRTGDLDEIVARPASGLASTSSDAARRPRSTSTRYDALASIRMNATGIARYWRTAARERDGGGQAS